MATPSGPGAPSLIGRVRAFYETRPVLGNFLLMAPAMVVILILSTQQVIMEPTQRLAMVGATIGLGGACAWVINQADSDDDPAP